MALGAKVKELRGKLGWKQVTLSKNSGIPQATISRIERGGVTQPKMGQLRKLAEALGTTIDYLAGDSVPEPIIFKCEDSLWQMLADGSKTFDARRWDLNDERIYRLAWGYAGKGYNGDRIVRGGRMRYDRRLGGFWDPIEKQVSFINKANGNFVTFEYRGMEFAPWAPGWCFLILGKVLPRDA